MVGLAVMVVGRVEALCEVRVVWVSTEGWAVEPMAVAAWAAAVD